MNHIDDLGGNTEDLLARNKPLPIDERIPHGDRERAIRRRGLTFLLIGVSLMGLAFFAAGTCVFVAEHATVVQAAFTGIALMALLISGTICTAVGCGEWQHRPMRSMQRELHDDFLNLRDEVAENRQTAREVITMVATLPDRLTAIEKNITGVPDYGRGVIDGMQARVAAMGPEQD